MDPKQENALIFRALARARLGELDPAARDIDQALALNAKSAQGLTARGEIWRLKGDADRAVRNFDEAIRLNPNQ